MKRTTAVVLAIILSLYLCSLSMGDLPEGALARLGKGSVYDAAISPDGAVLAVAEFKSIHLYEFPGLIEIGTLEAEQTQYSISFSPDGKLIAGASRYVLSLWDTADLVEIAKFKAVNNFNGIYSICFSPDSKLIATANYDRTVRLLDVETKEQVAILEGHPYMVESVSFSPDGSLLASGVSDGTLRYGTWRIAVR